MNYDNKYEGIITHISEDREWFTAHMKHLTDKSIMDEEIEFYFKEIHPSHREEVVIGVLFTWTYGYKTTDVSHSFFSEIVLHRLPRWTDVDIRTIEEEGRKLFEQIKGIQT